MTKQQSAIIKGVAILLMLLLHLNHITGIQGLNNTVAINLKNACHPINYFLIVSGYGLYYSYQQNRLTWMYLFKRTIRLYLAYWLVLLILVFGINSTLHPELYPMSYDKIILNLLGWRWDYCLYTWFLLPYVFMSLSAKWVFRVIDKLGNLTSLIITMTLYLGMSYLINRYFNSWLQSHYFVYHIVLWAQTLFGLTIGACFARQASNGEITFSSLRGKNLLLITLILASFVIRSFVHSSVLNPFHATFVIWLVLHITFNSRAEYIFVELGKKSMIMWFAQGFIDKIIFPQGTTILQWPIVVFILWTIACYLFASFLMPVVNTLSKQLRLTK